VNTQAEQEALNELAAYAKAFNKKYPPVKEEIKKECDKMLRMEIVGPKPQVDFGYIRRDKKKAKAARKARKKNRRK